MGKDNVKKIALILGLVVVGFMAYAQSAAGPSFGAVTVKPGKVTFSFLANGTLTVFGKKITVIAGGTLPVTNITPGSYDATVESADGFTESRTFFVSSGDDITINFSHKLQKAYKVGDKGPAGGLIAYDRGNYKDGWRFLEITSSDLSAPIPWNQTDQKPLSVCTSYRGGGCSDWRLPTTSEFGIISRNMCEKKVAGSPNGFYWVYDTEPGLGATPGHSFESSPLTEYDSDGNFRYLDMGEGNYLVARVRAIRTF